MNFKEYLKTDLNEAMKMDPKSVQQVIKNIKMSVEKLSGADSRVFDVRLLKKDLMHINDMLDEFYDNYAQGKYEK